MASRERFRKKFNIMTSATFMYGDRVKITSSCCAGILIKIETAKKAKIEYFQARAIESSRRAGHIFFGRTKGAIRAIPIKESIT
ncbi:MAG: hypothetical protein SCALA701_01580 [Candidatus Scalindua sp.]|nr:MAG: hypothetical protein SCALA701_01580 [Candidatus Scalindua sp.]